MKKNIKFILAFFVIILVTFQFTGCKEEKREFDFENVAAVKIVSADGTKQAEITHRDDAQKLIKQIEAITWVEEDSEDSQEDKEDASEYDEWIWRVQCYNEKGEKKQNILIDSSNRIVYKKSFWDAKEGELDLSIYAEAVK